MKRAAAHRISAWSLPLTVVLVTAAVFAPAIHNGFTNWDDTGYVLQNQLVRDLSPGGLKAIATTFVEGNYHPLTLLSLAFDYHFWKLNPTGYHLTNVALHAFATLALFWMIFVLTGSQELAAITSLFFGIHPLHVESVAWISGRKDLLYALFYFVACASYILWVRTGRPIHWACALASFLLSLLSKGMAVTLPLALVAIDFYLRRPWNARVWIEKVPFFTLSLVFGVIAIVAQKRATQEFSEFPLYERALVAFYGIAAYVVRAVAPVGLSAFYAYPIGNALPVTYYLAPLVAILLLTAIVISARGDRMFAFCGLFFLINIALVLQFYPVGSASMADRYTYVAYAGIGLALASGFRCLRLNRFAQSPALRTGAVILLGGLFVVWGIAARERVKIWKDNITLWSDVLVREPNLPMAYAHRAWSYYQGDEEGRAMADLQKALSLNPKDGEALSTRGTLYLLRGEYQRALADLDGAVKARPNSAPAVGNRGIALLRLGRHDEAIADLSKAIELKPWFTEAYLNRALAYGVKKEYARALPDLDRAIHYEPGNPQAYLWRGAARLELGDLSGAIADYNVAVGLAPGFGDAYFARSNAYERLGRYDDALRDALRARDAGYPVDDATIHRIQAGKTKPAGSGHSP